MPCDTAASVVLNGNSTLSATGFIDSSLFANTVTVTGTCYHDTNFSVFGGSSIKFGGDGVMEIPFFSGMNISNLAFTWEQWVRFSSVSVQQYFIGFGNSPGVDGMHASYFNISQTLYVDLGGGFIYEFAWPTPATSTFYYVSLARDVSATMKAYLAASGTTIATQIGSTMGAPTIIGGISDMRIGGRVGATSFRLNGHIESMRLTKGLCRYSGASYTVPATEFCTGGAAAGVNIVNLGRTMRGTMRGCNR